MEHGLYLPDRARDARMDRRGEGSVRVGYDLTHADAVPDGDERRAGSADVHGNGDRDQLGGGKRLYGAAGGQLLAARGVDAAPKSVSQFYLLLWVKLIRLLFNIAQRRIDVYIQDRQVKLKSYNSLMQYIDKNE